MDAPRQEHGFASVRHNTVELAQLLSKALAAACRSVNCDGRINTGHWGYGAYNNHPNVMAAVQCMAVSLVKCSGLVYHLPHDALQANSLAQHGIEFVCTLQELEIVTFMTRSKLSSCCSMSVYQHVSELNACNSLARSSVTAAAGFPLAAAGAALAV
eukprot:TRINITY_DN459_c0_g1_i1.p2 TRINITY_DN459_c0_g1~~TRINITY_DN459_c0_g1_i1.p2  ORF type:complete len:157 (-),score=25.71 TRINITY_DN459_c0_g1_i1:794-1264(-)